MEGTPTSPKRSKVTSHTPVRSGPTPQRQIAQKQVTINPTVMTVSTVKTKKNTKPGSDDDALLGVPAGLPVTEIGDTSETVPSRGLGVTDAFFGVPDSADSNVLPDLGQSKEITTDDILNQSQSQTLEACSTEEELDAADTLLSLSTIWDNLSLGTDEFDDNSLLMPIGGPPPIKDIAPEPLRLGQVEVDGKIARIITAEEQDKLENPNTGTLLGVPEDPRIPTAVVDPQNQTDDAKNIDDNKGQDDSEVQNKNSHKGARPKTQTSKPDDSDPKKGSRGAFRSQLYGLKRRSPKDRSYRCQICGATKRSTESLNAHHRKRHEKLNCTVCGKTFDLATSLTHHMYSHFPT